MLTQAEFDVIRAKSPSTRTDEEISLAIEFLRAKVAAEEKADALRRPIPEYSLDRERAIQARADVRDPRVSVAYRTKINGKRRLIDHASGFCIPDEHDAILAGQWADNAAERALAAFQEAYNQRKAGIEQAQTLAASGGETDPTIVAMLATSGQTIEAAQANAMQSAQRRAQSAIIAAELDAARAMAGLTGKVKRQLRNRLRAAKHKAGA